MCSVPCPPSCWCPLSTTRAVHRHLPAADGIRHSLTLTLNHSAFFSEILRSGVSAVGHGQLEAARSLGLGTFKTFRLIVFPQAFKTAMPPLTGQFVALLKETVICSVVGIPELLREALVCSRGRPTRRR